MNFEVTLPKSMMAKAPSLSIAGYCGEKWHCDQEKICARHTIRRRVQLGFRNRITTCAETEMDEAALSRRAARA
jgi:hypothetical protein